MSLIDKIKTKGKQITGGDLLSPEIRKSFEEIMRVSAKAKENALARQKANMIASGESKGLKADMLNAGILPEIDASTALTKMKAQKQKQSDTEEIKTKMIDGKPVKFKKTAEGWRKV
jgi:hypothetical protein